MRDLPIYLTARRSFHKLSNSGVDFILIGISEKEKFGAVAYEKQASLITEKYGMPVAFGFANVKRSQRDSLVERNIAFISDSGQLYLPFLGMALSDRFRQPKEIKKEKMMPVTQALFLHLLYHGNGNPVLKKDAAMALGVTRTSITRASDQLAAMGLILQEMHGKEYHMLTNGKGMQLFKKARPYLINPIQSTITTYCDSEYDKWPLSGESALSVKTMLNNPRIPIRAVYKSDVNEKQICSVDVRWNPEADVIRLELWKYDPKPYEKDGAVDPVSLAMCMEDNMDERVEGALEDYLEGYQW